MRKLTFSALLALALTAGAVNWIIARSATRADLLDVLPDGSGVAVIDFQKITGSALWATVSSQQKLKCAIDKAQSEIADIGVKLNDVHTVALVFSSKDLGNSTVAVNGGFDQSDVLERLRSNPKVKLTSEKYKGFDVYTVRSVPQPADSSKIQDSKTSVAPRAATLKHDASFVFRDSSTVVAGSAEAVRISVDVMTGARPSAAQDAQLADALAQSGTAAIRFAITLTPAMTGSLQSSELPIPDFSSVKLIFGAIEVASGIDLNATLRSDTAENAKSIAERLNGLLGMAKGYLGAMSDPKSAPIVDALKTVSITSSDIDVKITGSLPAELLNSLFASTERKAQ